MVNSTEKLSRAGTVNWNHVAQLLLGLLISGAAIAWIIAKSDWGTVGALIANMNLLSLVNLTVLVIFGALVRAWRWKYLLPVSSETTLRQRVDSIAIGALATNVLPLRAGEVVRPLVLKRYSGVSFSAGLASIIMERFFDLSLVLLLFGAVTLKVSGLPVWVTAGGFALSVAALGILVLMTASSFFPRAVLMAASKCFSPLPEKLGSRLMSLLSDFILSMGLLKSWRHLAIVCASSVAVWTIICLSFYEGFALVNMERSLWPAITCAAIVALAVAAPSAPGFIGVYQTGCIVSFALFGFDLNQAVAYSILTHLHQFLMYLAYGMYVLARDNIRLCQFNGEPVTNEN